VIGPKVTLTATCSHAVKPVCVPWSSRRTYSSEVFS